MAHAPCWGRMWAPPPPPPRWCSGLILICKRAVKCEYRSGNRNCSLYSGIFALYPTCKVSPRGRPETRKLGILILGVPPRSDPRGAPGNSETRNLEFGGPSGLDLQEEASETRKLGIWNLGVPWARTQEGASETRKLGIWNLPGPREYVPGICTLGILESGICGGVSWNLPMRKQGIWKLGSLRLRGPTEGPFESWKLGNSESGICRGVSWNLHTWKHGI